MRFTHNTQVSARQKQNSIQRRKTKGEQKLYDDLINSIDRLNFVVSQLNSLDTTTLSIRERQIIISTVEHFAGKILMITRGE